MTDADAPLRHIVEPGEYHVQWRLPSDSGDATTVIGTITLGPFARPTGNIVFDNVPLVWEGNGASFPQTFVHKLLYGSLSTNHDIVLLDAVIETWHPGIAHVSARAAVAGLLGHDFDGEVTGVQFQTTYLDRLPDAGPIKAFFVPQPKTELQEWRAVQADDLACTWESGAVSMTLEYRCRARVGDPYEMHVRYSAVATVQLPEASSVDAVISDWLLPAQALASLAVGTRADITFAAVGVSAGDVRRTEWLQLYGGGLAQSPLTAARWRGDEPQPVIRFGQASHSMLGMLQAWQALQRAGEPLFETYVSVLGVPDDHPRNRLLLLIQAIEGHYGSVHKDRIAAEDEEYAAARLSHVAALTDSDLDSTTKKFIRKHLASRPIRSLNTALDWAVTSLPGDLGTAFSETDIITAIIGDPRTTPTSWQDALRTIRNDLAHGNRSYNPGPLRQLTDLLDRVVRALVFTSVDADVDVLHKIVLPNR